LIDWKQEKGQIILTLLKTELNLNFDLSVKTPTGLPPIDVLKIMFPELNEADLLALTKEQV